MELNRKYFIAICANTILPFVLLYICWKIPQWFYFSYCNSNFLQGLSDPEILLNYVRYGAGVVNLILLIIHFVVNKNYVGSYRKLYAIVGILCVISGFWIPLYYVIMGIYFILSGGIHTQ